MKKNRKIYDPARPADLCALRCPFDGERCAMLICLNAGACDYMRKLKIAESKPGAAIRLKITKLFLWVKARAHTRTRANERS